MAGEPESKTIEVVGAVDDLRDEHRYSVEREAGGKFVLVVVGARAGDEPIDVDAAARLDELNRFAGVLRSGGELGREAVALRREWS